MQEGLSHLATMDKNKAETGERTVERDVYDQDSGRWIKPSPVIVGKGKDSPLPVGWTLTEYPSTFDIHDHTGRHVTTFPKPYAPTPLGELIAHALSKITIRKA